MKKLLVLLPMLLASITNAFASSKPNTNDIKKQTLLDKLKKEKVVKTQTSDSSGRTGGSGGGYVGPKDSK